MIGIIIIQFHNKYSAKILYFNIIPTEMDRVCHCSDLNVLLSVLKAVSAFEKCVENVLCYASCGVCMKKSDCGF